MVCHDPARGLSATEVSPPTHTVDLSETTAPGGRPRTRVHVPLSARACNCPV